MTIFMFIEMKFLGQGFQKLVRPDRQTHSDTQTDTTVRITTPR